VIDPSDDGKGSFRVLVFPDPDDRAWPQSYYLRQGVRVKGWVLLNQVPLGYELWRKFNDFPPVVDPGKSKKDDGLSISKELQKNLGKLVK
jgi:hypothetical protein